ncbi:hypothetical protein DP939_17740 [Spongiactinospora rosea]|uniref:NAD-dependent epimerase/dehydratase domain-containing protein n=1 Tax=Spongiactinospora rosea TaxID=2248750 RepID=A0A366M0R7_9ACTN|nr:NAD(P)-dependent oxidoreductase [Spongiactinospora rosea]RBQ19022.1 hypothetical protein DP939_17740 [Spongiactinospora rosea]
MARHELTVLDPAEPAGLAGVTHVRADVTAPGALDAVAGMDAVVHLAAVVPRDDAAPGVRGVRGERRLRPRRPGGGTPPWVPRFVHVSTMAVYSGYGVRPVDVTRPPDAHEPYGLSKRLAEEVCRTLAAGGGITALSLRLAYPTPDADWPLWRPPAGRPPQRLTLADGSPIAALSAADTAAALEAALHYEGPWRAFAITAAPATVTADDTPATLGWRPSGTTRQGAGTA